MSDVTAPLREPAIDAAGLARAAVPRVARHSFTLADGHRVGLTVSGHGVPLVVVHGFTAEGFLYAQTLSRLVAKGFKVVAVDMAGHGGTQGLPLSGGHLGDYAHLMGRVVEELGIRKAVLAGHSMGGRVAAQLAAQRPDHTVAVLLIDAIVGDQWDLLVNIFRFNPLLLAPMGAALALDSIFTMPVIHDPRQAVKLGKLL
ncbi:MAG TPA: alpha/beta fold hydrolase, partial [Acidimicrobiales bacterium]